MPLDAYRRKRDFSKTAEPAGGSPAPADRVTAGRFVVGRHRASRLHYDLRLEMDGVLASWAVPKGPSLDPDVKRIAIHVEDHPIEYFDFEGTIPRGEYGAGDAIVWDWGTYEPEAPTLDPGRSIADGELKFRIFGQKLRGRFTLVRTRGTSGSASSGGVRRRSAAEPESDRDGEPWLLIHKRDADAVPGWEPEDHRESVMTGRTNEEVAAGLAPRFEVAPPGEPAVARGGRSRGGAVSGLHRADAGDPGHDRVRQPGLAVRDQVGRLPGRGGGSRRSGLAPYPQRQGRRNVLSGPAQPAGLDHGRRGRRRRRGGRPGPGGHAQLRPPPGAPRGQVRLGDWVRRTKSAPPARAGRTAAAGRPRRSSTRPSTCSTSMACRSSRCPSRSASGCSGRSSATAPTSATRPTSSAPGLPSWPRRRRGTWRGSWPRSAARPTSPGGGSRRWLKLKHRPEQEFVIGGYLPGEGNARDLGSVIVGLLRGRGVALCRTGRQRLRSGRPGCRMRDLLEAARPGAPAFDPPPPRRPRPARGRLDRAGRRHPGRLLELDAGRRHPPALVQGLRARPGPRALSAGSGPVDSAPRDRTMQAPRASAAAAASKTPRPKTARDRTTRARRARSPRSRPDLASADRRPTSSQPSTRCRPRASGRSAASS